MIHSLLSKLPSLHLGKDDEEREELTDEELKKQRIKFHRERVRNGPVKFRTMTTGQVRREQKRELDRRTKKARRKQVRDYRRRIVEATTIHAMLQAAGVVSYVDPNRKAAPGDAANAIVWLIKRFAKPNKEGNVEVTREVVIDSLTRGLQTWQAITGQPVTPLSPAYELPVSVSE